MSRRNRSLLPVSPETDYLELWLTSPAVLTELAERIGSAELHSPVSRQLDLLARDMVERGIVPEFQRVMLRYDDERMKKFLVSLDESAAMKDLAVRLENEDERRMLIDEVVSAFERERIAGDRRRQISVLKETNLSSEERMSRLRELEIMLRQRQDNLSGGTGVKEDDGPKG